MNTERIYAEPQQITDINRCYFYHTMDIPNHGLIKGDWDLREGINDYLGFVNLKNKRVLEFGKANGGLTFEMEQQGAEVIGYDLSKNHQWDIVPYTKENYRELIKQRKIMIEKLNNAFWFAHHLFQSKTKVVFGDMYNVPNTIGKVDIATYGAILEHLQNPFLALQQGLRLVKETVIITDVVPENTDGPFMEFLPNAETCRPKDTWWFLPPTLVERMIGVLGFEDTTTFFHHQRFKGNKRKMYTVVGHRTHNELME